MKNLIAFLTIAGMLVFAGVNSFAQDYAQTEDIDETS